jgi:hypothetical protein
VAGISGTVIGSELSKFFSRYTRKAEAFVCSISLLTSIPFLFLSLTVVQYQVIYVSWITVFFAVFCVCLNWTPVAAMLLVGGAKGTLGAWGQLPCCGQGMESAAWVGLWLIRYVGSAAMLLVGGAGAHRAHCVT